jgi:flagellar biosynthesis protein FlhG
MPNQGLQLQQLMEDSRKKANVLAITSGKGGVGKTNISANLALCIAVAGEKTLLIDADFSLGNLDVVMNINSKYNISHFLNGRKELKDVIHAGPQGLEIICGVSGIEQLANVGEFQRKRLINELEKLQNDADTIIIDTAAGITKSVVSFCLSADQVLVVTTPEAAAMTDAYAMIKVLAGNKYEGKISLVVNMADSVAEGKKTYQHIAYVAKRFLDTNVYNAGVLLRDEQLLSAVRQRKAVVLAYPKAKFTTSIAAVAAKFLNSSSAKYSNGNFFKKFVDWFF